MDKIYTDTVEKLEINKEISVYILEFQNQNVALVAPVFDLYSVIHIKSEKSILSPPFIVFTLILAKCVRITTQ